MTDAGPTSIGFILDGNRRWAKENNLPTLEGHRRGMQKVKEILNWSKDAGIKDVVVYAFSTENWNRSPEEVAYLMDLFEEFADSWADDIKKKGGRIRFIGQRDRFRESLRTKIQAAEEKTKEGTDGTLWVALSYGGRAEIVDAVNSLLKQGVSSVDEASFKNAMWSAELPDPDLIVRTSGEYRLSNFLTWQSAYSELFFVDVKLPGFEKKDFDAVLEEYAARERRHGR